MMNAKRWLALSFVVANAFVILFSRQLVQWTYHSKYESNHPVDGTTFYSHKSSRQRLLTRTLVLAKPAIPKQELPPSEKIRFRNDDAGSSEADLWATATCAEITAGDVSRRIDITRLLLDELIVACAFALVLGLILKKQDVGGTEDPPEDPKS